jgi:hypothetical protein
MAEKHDSGVTEGLQQDGFFIDVVEGDTIDTGTGPPTRIPIATSMWVPKGTVLNGDILRSADDVGRR